MTASCTAAVSKHHQYHHPVSSTTTSLTSYYSIENVTALTQGKISKSSVRNFWLQSQKGVGTFSFTINPQRVSFSLLSNWCKLGEREGAFLLIPGEWAVQETWHILIFRSHPEAFALGPKMVCTAFLALSLTCCLTWDKSDNLMRSLKRPVPIPKWCANTCNCPPGGAMWWLCDTWPLSDRLTLWVQPEASCYQSQTLETTGCLAGEGVRAQLQCWSLLITSHTAQAEVGWHSW